MVVSAPATDPRDGVPGWELHSLPRPASERGLDRMSVAQEIIQIQNSK